MSLLATLTATTTPTTEDDFLLQARVTPRLAAAVPCRSLLWDCPSRSIAGLYNTFKTVYVSLNCWGTELVFPFSWCSCLFISFVFPFRTLVYVHDPFALASSLIFRGFTPLCFLKSSLYFFPDSRFPLSVCRSSVVFNFVPISISISGHQRNRGQNLSFVDSVSLTLFGQCQTIKALGCLPSAWEFVYRGFWVSSSDRVITSHGSTVWKSIIVIWLPIVTLFWFLLPSRYWNK